MPITIEHRRDGLLQKDRKDLESSAANYLLTVTYPTHRMLSLFLDKYVVGKKFESEAALQETLNMWPTFAKENNFELKSEWSEISANFLDKYICCGGGLDNDLVIGFIHALAE